MKTLVLANQKGGVGKSAVATLLAHFLAQHGQRVLAIDLDHQGNFAAPLLRSARATQADFSADRLFTEAMATVAQQPFVLVPPGQGLLMLERQHQQHSLFARNLRGFLQRADMQFDVCVIDTNPNPDIRVIAALVSTDFVLSPIQLNQEAIEGVHGLLNHERVGVRKIRALFNPKLDLIGILPTMVESTPFQKANFVQIIQRYHALMIRIGDGPGAIASMPRRSAIAEAQAAGEVLWEMKKTAARDCWKEIEPSVRYLASRLTAPHSASAPSAVTITAAAS